MTERQIKVPRPFQGGKNGSGKNEVLVFLLFTQQQVEKPKYFNTGYLVLVKNTSNKAFVKSN